MWSQRALGTDLLWLGSQATSGDTKPGCIGIAGDNTTLFLTAFPALLTWSSRDWNSCGCCAGEDPSLSHPAPRWGKSKGPQPSLFITGLAVTSSWGGREGNPTRHRGGPRPCLPTNYLGGLGPDFDLSCLPCLPPTSAGVTDEIMLPKSQEKAV